MALASFVIGSVLAVAQHRFTSVQRFESDLADILHTHVEARFENGLELISSLDRVVILATTAALLLYAVTTIGRSAAVLVAMTFGSGYLLLEAVKNALKADRLVDSLNMGPSWEFPSGHAFAAGLLAVCWLAFVERRAAAWAICGLSVIEGVLRLVAGRHYLIDVLTGACWGVAWGVMCLHLDQRLRRLAAVGDAAQSVVDTTSS